MHIVRSKYQISQVVHNELLHNIQWITTTTQSFQLFYSDYEIIRFELPIFVKAMPLQLDDLQYI